MNLIRFILIFIAFGTVQSQNIPKVNAGVNSSTINIGEQINFFLNVELDSIQKIEFPEKLQIAPMEILEIFPTDTQKIQNRFFFTKRYSLIQFESGFVAELNNFYENRHVCKIVPMCLCEKARVPFC